MCTSEQIEDCSESNPELFRNRNEEKLHRGMKIEKNLAAWHGHGAGTRHEHQPKLQRITGDGARWPLDTGDRNHRTRQKSSTTQVQQKNRHRKAELARPGAKIEPLPTASYSKKPQRRLHARSSPLLDLQQYCTTHQQLEQMRPNSQAGFVVVEDAFDPLADAPERNDEHSRHARRQHNQALGRGLPNGLHLMKMKKISRQEAPRQECTWITTKIKISRTTKIYHPSEGFQVKSSQAQLQGRLGSPDRQDRTGHTAAEGSCRCARCDVVQTAGLFFWCLVYRKLELSFSFGFSFSALRRTKLVLFLTPGVAGSKGQAREDDPEA